MNYLFTSYVKTGCYLEKLFILFPFKDLKEVSRIDAIFKRLEA